jgi:hypothetical protein
VRCSELHSHIASIFTVENETNQEAKLCLPAELISFFDFEDGGFTFIPKCRWTLPTYPQQNLYYPIFTFLATVFHHLLSCEKVSKSKAIPVTGREVP